MKRGTSYRKILRNALILFILPLGSILSAAYLAYHSGIRGYEFFTDWTSEKLKEIYLLVGI